MGYTEKITNCRLAIANGIAANSVLATARAAAEYAALLREMREASYSYPVRAKLAAEAEWYDAMVQLVKRDGLGSGVKRGLLEGRAAIEKPRSSATPPPEEKKPIEKPPVEKAPVERPKPVVENPFAPSKEQAPVRKPPAARSPARKAPAQKQPPAPKVEEPKAPPVTAEPAPKSAPVNTESDWGADLFERYLPATVVITTSGGVGSGFFISDNGFLLTNHHVVHNGYTPSTPIHLRSGDGKINCSAKLIAADSGLDVALLQIDTRGKKTPFIPLIKDYSTLRPGQEVILIGNGLDYGLAPVGGILKFPCLQSNGDMVSTVPANRGDSGGPVLDRSGHCIGINKSIIESITRGRSHFMAHGLTNATSADSIRRLLKRWNVKFKY